MTTPPRLAAAAAVRDPSLLAVTFAEVASGEKGLLDVHRDNGHFVLWLRPVLDALAGFGSARPLRRIDQRRPAVAGNVESDENAPGEHSPGWGGYDAPPAAAHGDAVGSTRRSNGPERRRGGGGRRALASRLLVLFLEELAADPVAVHRRAAAFVGLKESEMPFLDDGDSPVVVNRGGSSQAAGRHLERDTEETHPGGDRNGGPEALPSSRLTTSDADEHTSQLLLVLDDFYAQSTQELNSLLQSRLGINNTWWPSRASIQATAG